MSKLHLDIDEKLSIHSEDVIGLSAAILGITGSGKSNTSAVVVEELLANGFPMTIVDIEGEYYGLKERYDILVIGRGDHVDFEVAADQAGRLAEVSIERGITVVLDFNDFDQEEMFDFLLPYFEALWKAAGRLKRPYQVILEEAHEFVPQGTKTPLKQLLTRIALRGRKRGLAAVLISQRSSKVDKDLLTQAQLMFLHRVIHPIDVKVYEELIPLPAKEVDAMVLKLERGQAVVLFRNEPSSAQIRARSTFHAGNTPTMGAVVEPELRRLDASLLDDLRKALDTPEPEPTPEEHRQIRELEEMIERLGAENTDLQKALGKSTPEENRRIRELEEELRLLKIEHNRACDEIRALHHEIERRDEEAEPADQPADVLARAGGGEYLSSHQVNRRTSEQQKRFNFLKKDILELPRAQRAILRFLTEREGTPFSQREMAKRLDLSVKKCGETFDLEQLEVIVKSGRGINARYVSKVTSLIQRSYPQMDPAALKDELLHALMKKEVNNR